MNDSVFGPIPEQHRIAVMTACTTAFGPAEVSAVQRVTGGFSAQTFKLDIKGRAFLLRIDSARDPLRNPQRGYACMQTAEAAGLAPPLHYADAGAGIAIMDFIAAKPLTDYPGGNDALLRELGTLMARLQATPVFPPLANYFRIVKRMLDLINGTLFAPGLLDAHLAGFERIQSAYPWAGISPVSSHNDPNPRNILFDGSRLWLIDWETAFCNDPLVDVAILANNFAHTPEAETTLLQAWLGSTPSATLRARLLLMRLVTHLYYASIVLGGFVGKPDLVPHTTLDALTPEQLQLAFAQGQFKWGSLEATIAFAKIFLKAFADGMQLPQFERALGTAQA